MTSVKSDTGLLLDTIYEQMDVATALPELEPKRTGHAFTLKCPQCDKKRAFIYEGGHLITCNRRNECGYSATLWDYVTARDSLTSSQETLQALAKLAGYNLPSTLSSDALAALKRTQIQQTRLETAQALLTSRMFADEGKKEREYLHGRGYSDDDIRTMGLGVIPPKSALEPLLADVFVNNVNIVNTKISELAVVGYGTTHTLSIPYRNQRGQLIGWSVRSVSGADPKYKYSQGMETGSELYNLDQARGLKHLILVEAPLDALIATARGITGVVACGRNKPTTKQLDGLKALAVTSVTLALDSDTAGEQGTQDTLYALAERNIKGYVLTYPKGVKDLDEAIKKDGAEKVQELIDQAQAGYAYLIKCLQRKHENITDREQRETLDALIDLDAKLNDDLASKAITTHITETLGLAPDIIRQALADNRATKARAERERGYQSLQLKAGQLVQANKYDELEELYQDSLPSLRAKNVNTIIEPYTSEHFIADLQQRREGYVTGWSKLDEYTLIPAEAITIVAGRPSHGKTTVMLNMLYNLVTANPDESFYFFSYEETRSQLALKLITIMSGVQLDQYKNTQKIEQYFKTGRLDASFAKGLSEKQATDRLDAAKAEYDELVLSGRLWIVDEPLLVTDLTATIESLADSAYRVGAVFIDYIQKIKSKYNVLTRQVEIQKISGELLDTAKRSGVALVLGAQLNRGAERAEARNISLDQLRESGDIEQDAHLVLGLYNHNRGDYDANPDSEQTSDSVTTIDIKILKNRSGATNVYTSLTFDSPILTLREGEK